MHTEPVALGEITIAHNHGTNVLRDATWFPYPLGKLHYNEAGTNGYIEGTVVSGGSESRIFHYRSYSPLEVGSIKRHDYAPITRIHTDSNGARKYINLQTCG